MSEIVWENYAKCTPIIFGTMGFAVIIRHCCILQLFFNKPTISKLMHYSKLQKHNFKQYAVLVSLGNGFPGSFESKGCLWSRDCSGLPLSHVRRDFSGLHHPNREQDKQWFTPNNSLCGHTMAFSVYEPLLFHIFTFNSLWTPWRVTSSV